MKSNYIKILSLALTLISINSNAQEFKKNGFGLKAGVNASNLNTLKNTPEPFSYDSKAKAGFYVGFLSEFSLSKNKNFAIQPEIYYSQEGYKKTFTVNNESYKADYTLQLIKVPVLLKYYICDQFSFVLGPQFSFFGNQKMKFNNNYEDNNYQSGNRNLKDFDFGIASGLSFNAKGGLSVDFRYNHGTKSIYKNENDVTTRSLELGLSYKF